MTIEDETTPKLVSIGTLVLAGFLVAGIESVIGVLAYYVQLNVEINWAWEVGYGTFFAIVMACYLIAMVWVSLRRPTAHQMLFIFCGCLVAQGGGRLGNSISQNLEMAIGEFLLSLFHQVHYTPIRSVLDPLSLIIFVWLPMGLGLYFAYRPRLPMRAVLLISVASVVRTTFWAPSLEYDGNNLWNILVMSQLYAFPGLWLHWTLIGLMLRWYAPVVLNLRAPVVVEGV